MFKLSTVGLLSLLGGVLVLVFQTISSLVEQAGWVEHSLDTLLDPKYLGWMDGASWFGLEKIAVYLVMMPLFMLLIGLGVLLLTVSFFTAK